MPVRKSHGYGYPPESQIPTRIQPFLQSPSRHAYRSAVRWSLVPQMKAFAYGEADSEARQCLRQLFRPSWELGAHPKDQRSSLNGQIPAAWHLLAQSSVEAALQSRVLNLNLNYFADHEGQYQP